MLLMSLHTCKTLSAGMAAVSVMFQPPAGGYADITVEELRSRIRASYDSVRSARVEYLYTVLRPEIGAVQLKGLAPEDIRYVNTNRNRAEHCVLAYDVASRRYRLDQTDLRDLGALIEAAGLTEDKRGHLSRTSIVIGGPVDTGEYRLGHSMMIRPRPRTGHPATDANSLLVSPLRTGCFTDRLFDRALRVETAEQLEDGPPTLSVTFNFNDTRTVILLDPALDYRYVRYDRFDLNDRLLEQRTAGDYRFIDGVPYPFHHEQTRWNASGRLIEREIVQVLGAQLNTPLSESEFEVVLPAGLPLIDMVHGWAIPLPGTRTVTGGTIDQVSVSVRDETAPRSAMAGSDTGPDREPSDAGRIRGAVIGENEESRSPAIEVNHRSGEPPSPAEESPPRGRENDFGKETFAAAAPPAPEQPFAVSRSSKRIGAENPAGPRLEADDGAERASSMPGLVVQDMTQQATWSGIPSGKSAHSSSRAATAETNAPIAESGIKQGESSWAFGIGAGLLLTAGLTWAAIRRKSGSRRQSRGLSL